MPVPHVNDVVLEGEDDQVDETTLIPTAAVPPSPPIPPTAPPAPLSPLNPPTPIPVAQPIAQPEKCGTCIQKPSQYVRDVQSGKGSAQGLRNQPAFPQGMPVPKVMTEEVNDDGETENVEGELVEEIPGTAMAAKMAEAHGLEPQSLKEAMRSPNWPSWQEAMHQERKALKKFSTWRLKKPPPNANIIGCHWTFVVKHDAAGAIARYCARLVAQGFSQVPGIDFFETYAPVAKMASMHALFAMLC